MNLSYKLIKHFKRLAVSAISTAKDIYGGIYIIVDYRVGVFPLLISVMLPTLYCPMVLQR